MILSSGEVLPVLPERVFCITQLARGGECARELQINGAQRTDRRTVRAYFSFHW
jgi:hypothetical protein